MKLPFDTDAGFGTRARLGAIVLETDETLEAEFAQILRLGGVALFHSRIPMVTEINSQTLARMEADLPAAARLLPAASPCDVVGYGCTSASTVIGSDKVAQAIQSVLPNTRVTDPLEAIIAGLSHLQARRIGFLTPYVPEVSRRMRDKLESAGFEIVAFGSFEESNDSTVARITESSILNAAEQIASKAPCDTLVISCTNLRCLRILPQIEERLGVSAISSNQALAWRMLRLAGVNDTFEGFGRLLSA